MRVSLLNKVEDAHEDALWCVAWQPDSRSLITGSVDETVKVWTLGEPGSTTVESAHTYTGHTLGVISVAIDATGKFAASSALDSFIRVWNLEVTRVLSEKRKRAERGAPPAPGPAHGLPMLASRRARTTPPSPSSTRRPPRRGRLPSTRPPTA